MPVDLPAPPGITVSIQGPQATGAGSAPQVPLQAAQPPLQIPGSDLVVEVVGELPVRTRIEDVTRLLAQRHLAQSTSRSQRTYLPTILELIRLVKSNPAKPRGRAWDSIRALSIRFDSAVKHVTVEYCLDYCDRDPTTGASHPRRKMVSYTASEQLVVTRANKKLRDLEKYAERPPSPDR
jgi:hypothetical protein